MSKIKKNPMQFKSPTSVLIAAMRELANTIKSDDGAANAAISEAADRLEELETESRFLRSEYNDISALVKFDCTQHDSLTNAMAIALDEQKKYTVQSAIEYLQSMISGVFCDDTKIVIFKDETPEIILNTDAAPLRYEIPMSNDSETDQFIESLAWISGQYIEDAA